MRLEWLARLIALFGIASFGVAVAGCESFGEGVGEGAVEETAEEVDEEVDDDDDEA